MIENGPCILGYKHKFHTGCVLKWVFGHPESNLALKRRCLLCREHAKFEEITFPAREILTYTGEGKFRSYECLMADGTRKTLRSDDLLISNWVKKNWKRACGRKRTKKCSSKQTPILEAEPEQSRPPLAPAELATEAADRRLIPQIERGENNPSMPASSEAPGGGGAVKHNFALAHYKPNSPYL